MLTLIKLLEVPRASNLLLCQRLPVPPMNSRCSWHHLMVDSRCHHLQNQIVCLLFTSAKNHQLSTPFVQFGIMGHTLVPALKKQLFDHLYFFFSFLFSSKAHTLAISQTKEGVEMLGSQKMQRSTLFSCDILNVSYIISS